MVHHQKYPLFTFDLYLGVKITQTVAQYPQHYVTYAPAKFEVHMSNGLGGDAFTRKYITQYTKSGQYPPHHMTDVPAEFEVDTFNSLGDYAFTRKDII